MQPFAVITNGGPHSAATHAGITAFKILDLIQTGETPIALDNPDHDAIEAAREAGRQGKARLKPLLEAAFVDHHATVIDAERAALADEGAARLSLPIEPFEHTDEAAMLASVQAVLAASPFAAAFAKPGAVEAVRRIVDQELSRVMHEEHRWFADDPDADEATKAHHATHFPQAPQA
jgi:hypothetical protein